MRSARAELSVIRTIFGLPAAREGTAFRPENKENRQHPAEHEVSLLQRLKPHAGESPAASQPRLT